MKTKAPNADKGMDAGKRYTIRNLSDIDTGSVRRLSPEDVLDFGMINSREHQIAEKCGSTMRLRSASLRDVLSAVSSLDALLNISKAEHKAFVWIDEHDKLIVCAHTQNRVLQRYVAALFYFSMHGDEWLNCRSWTSDVLGDCSGSQRWLDKSHECEWFGVSCDGVETYTATDSIASINLKKNNLQGTILVELFRLQDRMALILANNKSISGSIPKSVSNLNKLTLLDLSNHALSGSFPESIYEMT